MSAKARLTGRSSRLLWGGVALGLLAILGVSFLMAGRALDGAKADAEQAEGTRRPGVEPDRAGAGRGRHRRARLPGLLPSVRADPLGRGRRAFGSGA
jgi:hypothetical protein